MDLYLLIGLWKFRARKELLPSHFVLSQESQDIVLRPLFYSVLTKWTLNLVYYHLISSRGMTVNFGGAVHAL